MTMATPGSATPNSATCRSATLTKRGFGKKIVAHRTPDTGWAWVIACSCCLIHAIIFGIYRAYGVLYVALIKYYGVSRETAAWPFSLCLTVFHMTGIISGVLSSYYTTRTISVLGCLIATSGLALCWFATSVDHIIILIGIVKGFGYGLIGTQTPVIINQYFSKYRATASGLALAGGTIGSFVLPPLVKVILAEYQLHGCFLILGGFILNTLPITLLLRPPIPAAPDAVSTESHYSEKSDIEAINESLLKKSASNNRIELMDDDLPAIIMRSKDKQRHLSLPTPFEMTRGMIIASHRQENKLSVSEIGKLFDQASLVDRYHAKKASLELSCICESCSTRGGSWTSTTFDPPTMMDKVTMAVRSNATIIFELVRNPLFVILCTTQVCFTWGWTTYSMVIVDFAVDRDVGLTEAVVLLSAFSLADLFGRLGSGWISDKGFIKRRNVAFASILAIGILLWMLPLAADFTVLFGISLGLGLFTGSLIILFSILLVEYVGIETMPLALGTSTFFCGLATLFRPLIIGYFRDVHQSYDGLFQFLGILCILVSILWLVEPCAHLWHDRNEREKVWTKRMRPSIHPNA